MTTCPCGAKDGMSHNEKCPKCGSLNVWTGSVATRPIRHSCKDCKYGWDAEPSTPDDGAGLKPCPFCGEKNPLVQKLYRATEEGLSKTAVWYVECSDGYCASRTGDCGMYETALEIWNRRAKP